MNCSLKLEGAHTFILVDNNIHYELHIKNGKCSTQENCPYVALVLETF